MLYVISLFAVALGVALDQYTKYLAITNIKENPIILIKDVFQLQYLENYGAAFGMLQNQQLLFLLVGVITLCLIGYIYIRMPKTTRFIPLRVCMISIVAGAVGNMIDRVRVGYVVDFFYFELIDFPIFNVADIFASVATVVLVILFLFYYKEEDMDCLFGLFSKKNNSQEQ